MGQSAQLQIGGRQYTVVSSASQEELDRLGRRVELALNTVGGGRQLRAERGLLLAALRLAHDAEESENRRLAEKAHYKNQPSRYLDQLNQILGKEPKSNARRRAPARKFEVQSISPHPLDAKEAELPKETLHPFAASEPNAFEHALLQDEELWSGAAKRLDSYDAQRKKQPLLDEKSKK